MHSWRLPIGRSVGTWWRACTHFTITISTCLEQLLLHPSLHTKNAPFHTSPGSYLDCKRKVNGILKLYYNSAHPRGHEHSPELVGFLSRAWLAAVGWGIRLMENRFPRGNPSLFRPSLYIRIAVAKSSAPYNPLFTLCFAHKIFTRMLLNNSRTNTTFMTATMNRFRRVPTVEIA